MERWVEIGGEKRSLAYGVTDSQQLAILLGADVFSIVSFQCHLVAKPLHCKHGVSRPAVGHHKRGETFLPLERSWKYCDYMLSAYARLNKEKQVGSERLKLL